jgi:hypothetical protein
MPHNYLKWPTQSEDVDGLFLQNVIKHCDLLWHMLQESHEMLLENSYSLARTRNYCSGCYKPTPVMA